MACPPQARDPIPQLRNYILEQGLLSEAQLKDLEKEVIDVVEDAVKFADESPKPVRALRPTLGFLPGQGAGLQKNNRVEGRLGVQ